VKPSNFLEVGGFHHVVISRILGNINIYMFKRSVRIVVILFLLVFSSYKVILAVNLSDSFNRSSLGSDWTNMDSNTFDIVSNELNAPNTDSVSIVYNNKHSFSGDHYVEINGKSNDSDAYTSVILNYQDADHFYLFQYNNTECNIYLNNSGYTQIATTSCSRSNNTFYNIKLELIGSSLKGYIDDVEKLSATNSTLTTGYSGVSINSNSGHTTLFDDFVSDNFATPTPTSTPTNTPTATPLASPTPGGWSGATPNPNLPSVPLTCKNYIEVTTTINGTILACNLTDPFIYVSQTPQPVSNLFIADSIDCVNDERCTPSTLLKWVGGAWTSDTYCNTNGCYIGYAESLSTSLRSDVPLEVRSYSSTDPLDWVFGNVDFGEHFGLGVLQYFDNIYDPYFGYWEGNGSGVVVGGDISVLQKEALPEEPEITSDPETWIAWLGWKIDYFWVTFKNWFVTLIDPSQFLSILNINDLKTKFSSKAPFAYVSTVLGQSYEEIDEETNAPNLTLNIMGTDYDWEAPTFLSGSLTIIKNALIILLWVGFLIYLWILSDRIITK
jgi:hypothetical protein